ncbi:hypothetical protein [Klebsiella pneumoniae]|uniref:hypothetical protein n=1 Tax=Klebsiella pneumoniae TaxID=573 RepID=UPI00115A27EE|nr:hypothetical protein [Klebsiella pneumoniae]HCX3926403.1 hypothetical protein [Escherichia coli]
MNAEEKLMNRVEKVLFSQSMSIALTIWEKDFLLSISKIFKASNNNPYSLKSLSPKQKNRVFSILKSHGFHEV